MEDILILFGIIAWGIGVWWLLSMQTQFKRDAIYKKGPSQLTTKAVKDAEMRGPTDFVPVEDARVPTHASQSNKWNNKIGNHDSGVVGPAHYEVVVPSDWYMSRTLPTEFDGPYWPSGSIAPDFIFPGSDPARPLRPQSWPAAYSVSPETYTMGSSS
jgi:hypothetical protein